MASRSVARRARGGDPRESGGHGRARARRAGARRTAGDRRGERRRRRVLALAGRACRRHRRARARAGPRDARRAAGRSSCAKASSSWPTASSARSTGSRTGSTRKSCSTTRRRRPAWTPTRARGWRWSACSPGREHEAAADLACHFHGAGDHLRAARYLRVAAGNAIRSGTRRAKPRRSCTAPSPTRRTWPGRARARRDPADARARTGTARGRRNGPRDTDAHQARAARRRRAPSRRSPSGAAGARRRAGARSLARPRSTAPARSRSSRRSRPMPRWPRPRRFAPASSSCTSTGGRTRSPTAASRRGASFLDTSMTSIGRSPSDCSSCRRRARPTRTRGPPDGNCCPSRSRAATWRIAPTATTCWASPPCISGAGTRRRRSRPRETAVCERTGSTRLRGHACGCCRRGSRSKVQRFDEATGLSAEDRPLVETGGWANARQMSLLIRRRLGPRARAARRRRRRPRVPARLVCPRTRPDGLVLGSAAPHLPRGALAPTWRPRARDDRSIGRSGSRHAPHQSAPGEAART